MNRIPVKWVRDFVKSHYKKGSCCAVCGVTEKLEHHHYTSISLIFRKWLKAHGIKIKTDEDVLEVRESFAKDHWFEVVEDMVTLCNTHHKQLHKVYGKEPPLSTVEKQRRWVSRQKQKIEDKN